jgi:hypothetical protein
MNERVQRIDGMTLTGKPEELGIKAAPVSLSRGDLNRVSAVKGRRLTVSTMSRPQFWSDMPFIETSKT